MTVPTFKGMTLRNAFLTTDPRVRFVMPDRTLATAGEIAEMRRIPSDWGGAIYTAFEDEEGYIYIGIAPSVGSDDRDGWMREQMERPVFKSIDRVDLLGGMIGGAD